MMRRAKRQRVLHYYYYDYCCNCLDDDDDDDSTNEKAKSKNGLVLSRLNDATHRHRIHPKKSIQQEVQLVSLLLLLLLL
jgi:hypothetical protein